MNKMRGNLKQISCRCVSMLNLPYFFHKFFFRKQLSIIMYHAIINSPMKVADWCFLDSQQFYQQITYFKEKFEILPLSKAVDRCRNGCIDRPTMAITFDDGYQNNFDVAFPILKKFEIPATIFLNTRYIDTDETIWYCQLNKALVDTPKNSLLWDGYVYDISDSLKKSKVSAILQSKLKECPQPLLMKKLDILLEELEIDNKNTISKNSPFHMLDSISIKKMSGSGLIEFGAHTHSHTILSLLPKQDQLDQIVRSIRKVEELTGTTCNSFSYPNGCAQDFNLDTINLLKECGIRYAVTTIPGGNSGSTPFWALRRYGIGADSNMDYLQIVVHHCSLFSATN